MSNKTKKKHTVKLYPGDSAIVLPYETLMYMAGLCDTLAGDQVEEKDAQAWRDLADDIRYQCNENHFSTDEADLDGHWV